MKRLKVPFLEKIFLKNNDDIRDINGDISLQREKEYVGIRSGISLSPMGRQ